MKYLYTLALVLFSMILLSAQGVDRGYTHKMSALHEKGLKPSPTRFILDHPEYSFGYRVDVYNGDGLKTDHSKMTLMKYDSKMNPIADHVINATDFDKHATIETCLNIGGNPYMMISIRQSDKSFKLFAHAIDANTMDVSKEGKLLGQTGAVEFHKTANPQLVGYRKHVKQHFEFIHSANRQQWVAFIGLRNYKDAKNKYQREVIGFDSKFEDLWKKEISVDFESDVIFPRNYHLTNSGQFILELNQSYNIGAKKSAKETAGVYFVSVGKDGQKVMKFSEMETEEKTRMFPTLTKDKNPKSTMVASLSKSQTLIISKLTFNSDIDVLEIIEIDPKSLQEIDRNITKIGSEYIKGLASKNDGFVSVLHHYKSQSKSKKGKQLTGTSSNFHERFHMTDVLFADDGSFYVVGSNKASLFLFPDMPDHTNRVEFRNHDVNPSVFGDLVVMHIGPDKKLSEIVKIPSTHQNGGGFYSGNSIFRLSDNKLFVLYVDNIANDKHKSERKFVLDTQNSAPGKITIRIATYTPGDRVSVRKLGKIEEDKLMPNFLWASSVLHASKSVLFFPYTKKFRSVAYSKFQFGAENTMSSN